ncbi:hypothetical protein [Kitasatospora sp. NPDC057500]|uniref:hypothetical protein n=1 Tax=Kitasatospora sp. NPDC057500 TaxID=3346151 RepID=UPI0036A20632
MVVDGQDRRALEPPGEDRVDGVGQAEPVPLVLAEQLLGVGVQSPIGRRQDDEALPCPASAPRRVMAFITIGERSAPGRSGAERFGAAPTSIS